jgi:hypothetical protein
MPRGIANDTETALAHLLVVTFSFFVSFFLSTFARILQLGVLGGRSILLCGGTPLHWCTAPMLCSFDGNARSRLKKTSLPLARLAFWKVYPTTQPHMNASACFWLFQFCWLIERSAHLVNVCVSAL